MAPVTPQQDGVSAADINATGTKRRGSAGRPAISPILSICMQEGEALTKEMGHTEDGSDLEGRRTRSSTRGAPPTISPPPMKMRRQSGWSVIPTPNSTEKKKPALTLQAASKERGRGGRGRRKKSDAEAEAEEEGDEDEKIDTKHYYTNN